MRLKLYEMTAVRRGWVSCRPSSLVTVWAVIILRSTSECMKTWEISEVVMVSVAMSEGWWTAVRKVLPLSKMPSVDTVGKLKDLLSVVVVDALDAFAWTLRVRLMDSGVVSYGQCILRLAVGFPRISCDPNSTFSRQRRAGRDDSIRWVEICLRQRLSIPR